MCDRARGRADQGSLQPQHAIKTMLELGWTEAVAKKDRVELEPPPGFQRRIGLDSVTIPTTRKLSPSAVRKLSDMTHVDFKNKQMRLDI